MRLWGSDGPIGGVEEHRRFHVGYGGGRWGSPAPPHPITPPSPSLCPTDKYAVRFIPRENGVYSIDVKFDGAHIPGSPFKVRVGDPGQAGDPGLVTAYGAGLEGGTTGRGQR